MSENALITHNEVKEMAKHMGPLFGKKPEDMFALMLLAQAHGMHPAIAAQEYDIIQGKPAINSKSALARFQKADGSIQWIERSDKKASAKFSHPQGGEITIEWDMERAKKAQLTGKQNWQKYPAQMLSARVVAEGVRAVYPACLSGLYTVEEVGDFDAHGKRQHTNTPPTPQEPPKPQQEQEPRNVSPVETDEEKVSRIFSEKPSEKPADDPKFPDETNDLNMEFEDDIPDTTSINDEHPIERVLSERINSAKSEPAAEIKTFILKYIKVMATAAEKKTAAGILEQAYREGAEKTDMLRGYLDLYTMHHKIKLHKREDGTHMTQHMSNCKNTEDAKIMYEALVECHNVASGGKS